MAKITCNINQDDDGYTTVTCTVHRIDENDEVTLVTDTPNYAMKWVKSPPFAQVAENELYLLPLAHAPAKPLQVTKTTLMNHKMAICGELDTEGKFTAYPGDGFPDIGSKAGAQSA